MLKKIIFIDQTSEKNHHMVFNAAFINMLTTFKETEQVVYYGIPSSQTAVKQLLYPETLEKTTFEAINYSQPVKQTTFFKAFNYLKKEAKRYHGFKSILKNADAQTLCILSITTFTSFFLLKLLKLRYKTPKFIAVLHGDIDFLYVYRTRMEKIVGQAYKQNLKTKASNFYYILLNKISKQKLIASKFLSENEVLEIDHPYSVLQDYSNDKIIQQDTNVNIGHIGSMEVERKNSHLIFSIAKSCAQLIAEKKINFQTIGLVTPSVIPYKNELVTEMSGNTRPDLPDYLTRAEYENYASKLHFVLFLYADNQYVYRTSGAVIDAIAMEIPIIYFEHPYFDELASRYGPIGYRCKNIEEVVEVIAKIGNKERNTISDYNVFKSNLKKLKKEFEESFIAASLHDQICDTVINNVRPTVV